MHRKDPNGPHTHDVQTRPRTAAVRYGHWLATTLLALELALTGPSAVAAPSASPSPALPAHSITFVPQPPDLVHAALPGFLASLTATAVCATVSWAIKKLSVRPQPETPPTPPVA